ncbi:uncharacterized protein LOC129597697 [Paramacrobiotus metropolitanus]|uniref:uncharacterized protein LOC129597697 n=1 Tax=Paramacrobiotus metropolitanus TaxID=2943436 RepID=UPI002445E770|nr:uncharacterized protein LOC129597697 [Paramacrobiotus metropolitanus]
MAVPVLPIFDEDDDPGNSSSFGISAGKILFFIAAVRMSRYVKQKVWSDDLYAIRRLWLDCPHELGSSSVLAGLCLVVNIAMAACMGTRLVSTGQKYPINLCSGSSLWIITVFFVVSQMTAAIIRIPPTNFSRIHSLLPVMPASSTKFVLHLDFLAVLCVLPVIVTMLYCGVQDVASVGATKLTIAFLLSSLSVMTPSLQADEGIDNEVIMEPARKHFLGAGDNIDPDVCRAQRLSQTITIKANGCSPSLLLRIQQMQGQQEEIEQQLHKRRHKRS